jgi:hypothetical protein
MEGWTPDFIPRPAADAVDAGDPFCVLPTRLHPPETTAGIRTAAAVMQQEG